MIETNGFIYQISISAGGVPKQPVPSGEVTPLGLIGDQQAHPEVHGGTERALCLYSLERINALQAEGHPIFPGAAGENLTISGLDWMLVQPGAHLQLGSQVVVEVTKYTTPCKAITGYFKDKDAGRILHDRFPGWARVYVKVLTPGPIAVGNPVWILPA